MCVKHTASLLADNNHVVYTSCLNNEHHLFLDEQLVTQNVYKRQNSAWLRETGFEFAKSLIEFVQIITLTYDSINEINIENE